MGWEVIAIKEEELFVRFKLLNQDRIDPGLGIFCLIFVVFLVFLGKVGDGLSNPIGPDIEVDADGEAVVVGGGGLETHFDCVGWRLCVCGVVVYEVVVM